MLAQILAGRGLVGRAQVAIGLPLVARGHRGVLPFHPFSAR